jgi:hypothetical protein
MAATVSQDERAKWDTYYRSVELPAETPVLARFGADFAAAVSELLPRGGRVLEAGAGAGWHSLALHRTGRFEVTLLDFSEEALRHARALFAREGRAASFLLGDARAPGPAEYDLVFNSGVLEHFPFAEQVQMLRAMASRSTSLVLALVPNRRCYWYWIWRVQAAARGDWPFGDERPATSLLPAFAAAGLDVVGERVLGAAWTESFFDYLDGIEPALRAPLLAVHRSPLIDADVKGYLLGALGRVAGAPAPAVPDWTGTAVGSEGENGLAGALADALALQVQGQTRWLRLQEEAARQLTRMQEAAALHGAERDRLQAQLQADSAARAVEQGEYRRQLDEANARAGTMAAASAALQAQLGVAGAERDRAVLQVRALTEEQCAAKACHQQLLRERDELLRQHRELQAWHAHVSSSLTFRLLRRLDQVRARLRGRRGPVTD